MDAGSAVGIVSLGTQVCQGLLDYYYSWKSYRTDINTAYDCIADLYRTFELLRDTLSISSLDPAKARQVRKYLDSCVHSLYKLQRKLGKLRTHPLPCGFNQKAWARVQRSLYPFKESTLVKLRELVRDLLEQLSLALQVLHLDIDTTSHHILTQVEVYTKDTAARTVALETLVAHVSAQNERLLAAQQADQFRKIVDWLSPPDPWANHASARRHHEPETGSWLLQSDQYKRWRDGHNRHLWLYGKAGCGKTILTSTVIEDLQLHCENTRNAGLAVFYFSFSDTGKQSFDSLLCSLVAQLGWKEPGRTTLQQKYDKPNRRLLGPEALQEVLLSSILQFDDVFMLVDGLDECPDRDNARRNTLDCLGRLSQKAPNFKIFATSRELLDIRESMVALGAAVFPISTRPVNVDIGRYVSRELSRDRKLSTLDEATKTLIMETFEEKVDGMFQWAYCQLQELKKLKSSKPKFMKAALNSLPATLDATYERILSGIEEIYREEALVLLRWLAYAQTPLSLGEVAEATIIDLEKDASVDVDNRGNVEDTLNILSGLIVLEKSILEQYIDGQHLEGSQHSERGSLSHQDTDLDIPPLGRRAVRHATVRLAHFSVKEYLESKRITESVAQDFHLDMAREHRFLTHSCLAYITYYSRSAKKSRSEHDLTTFPLLAYSAHSWFWHSSLQDSSDVSRETTFLSTLTSKHDWLSIYQPDRPRQASFGQLEDVGSGLYYASITGLQTVAIKLIEAGSDVDAQGGEYGSALGAASCRGHENITKMLIERGANINIRGSRHRTALHYAVLHNWGECIQLLLEGDAEITTDIENMTALHYTARIERPELAKVFLNAGILIDAPVKRKFWTCYFNGNQRVWKSSDDPQLAQVNQTGGAGLTPLHYAVLTGSEVMTKFFLENGANVNALSQYNETPLHLALKQDIYGPEWRSGHEDNWNSPHFRIDYVMDLIGLDIDNEEEYSQMQKWVETQRFNIFETLLNYAETDLTCKDIFNMGLLHCVRYGTRSSTSFLERLLSKGIPINLHNSKGQTALHLACLQHDLGAIQSLLKHGASIVQTDAEGLNALHYAARSADASCMQLVLDSATQTQFTMITGAKDNRNRNALHHLVVHAGYVDIAAVKCSKTGGIDVNGIDDEGYPPLARYLCRFLDRSAHKAEVAGYLFQAHADPSFRTVDGLTLGHLSASADELDIELLQVLANNAVDLHLPDRNRRTILHHCALAGSLTTKSALNFFCHEVGLSISSLDISGKTALDLAVEALDKDHDPMMFRPERWSTTEQLLRAYELDYSRSPRAKDVNCIAQLDNT